MRKGLLALSLLAILLAAVLLNVKYLSRFTDEFILLIDQAQESALRNDWDAAVEKGEEAERYWLKGNPYIHIVIRYSEISATSAAIYAFLSEIYKEDAGGVLGTGKLLREQIKGVYEIECVNVATIF